MHLLGLPHTLMHQQVPGLIDLATTKPGAFVLLHLVVMATGTVMFNILPINQQVHSSGFVALAPGE